MAISAAQYALMRNLLRGALSGNYPGAANPSDGEVLGFFNQLFTDSGGTVALSSAKQNAVNAAMRSALTGNVAAIANPNDADVQAFVGQLRTDTSGVAALSAQRYSAFKTVLADRLAGNLPGATNPSQADLLSYFGSFGALGAVANRTYLPTTKSGAGSPSWFVQTRHTFRDTVSAIQIAWPNYYCNGGEVATGNTLTLTASIEYPSGTRTQITFAGSATGTVASGGTLWSDTMTIPGGIPSGAQPIIRFLQSNPAGVPYSAGANPKMYVTGGVEGIESTTTDKTMAGNVVDPTGSNGMFPCAIIGITSKRNIVALGDSRQQGFWDPVDATGNVGEISRPLSPTYGMNNLAVSGETMAQFLASNTQRLLLAQYGTTIISGYGINDIQGAANLATLQTRVNTMRALFPTQEFWALTVAPRTTGAWTAVDGSDQTLDANNSVRVSFNNWIRGLPAGLTGYLELADFMESSSDSGKWKANGTAQKYTFDGVHEQQFANQQITFSLP